MLSTSTSRKRKIGQNRPGDGHAFWRQIVLVLRRSRYSYSYSIGALMSEPIFDHDRLDVYRLSIDYVASSFAIAKDLNGLHRHARDQWLRAAQSIPLNIAEGRTIYCLRVPFPRETDNKFGPVIRHKRFAFIVEYGFQYSRWLPSPPNLFGGEGPGVRGLHNGLATRKTRWSESIC
jgi:hypothetical protein